MDKQNKFADKFGFKYNLLADDSRELIDAFGVWGKKNLEEMSMKEFLEQHL